MRNKRFGGALFSGGAPLLVSALLALGACTGAERGEVESFDAEAYVAAGNVIDSTFPMEEEIRRFRAGMPEIRELSSEAESKEELVDNFLRALERADTATAATLAITREEFAWLYFPYSINASPPYELQPGLVWMQIQNASSAGLRNVMRIHGGETLYDTGLHCPEEGVFEAGTGRIWDECVILGELPSGEEVEERLFGSILEVGGRYKFVSFANGL